MTRVLSLEDLAAIAELVWPGTATKGIAEVLRRVTTLSCIEEGKDGGATAAEVERARAALLERMAETTNATEPSTSARHGAASTSTAHEREETR